jgi:dTDP-4-amino-4,6-dideoxygalactose transaminase
MNRPLALGLSPNTEVEDVQLALKLLLLPWQYKKGKAPDLLEQWFQKFFGISSAISFANGRSALYAVLSALEIGKGDEIILQAFTCVVVPDAIIATGAKPVYADIEKTLTLHVADIERKITKKTKAILVQHTFGIPTDMDAIMQLARKYDLFVIEDVAHTIGEEYRRKKLGTIGTASIFSFGRDKAFSSVFGGMAITKDKELGRKIRQYQRQRPYPTIGWIAQQLFHPVALSLILPLYDTFSIGKIILVLLQKAKLLSFPVSSNEKRGKFYPSSVCRFPNALAVLALQQVEKLHRYNERRKEISKNYLDHADELHLTLPYRKIISFLRFPVYMNHPATARAFFRQFHIYLGDWYANVIDPRESNFSAVGYIRGSCPIAEQASKTIVNLPTYPLMTDDDVRLVLDVLKQYASQ